MKITNNSSPDNLAKLGLGVPSGSAKHQLGLMFMVPTVSCTTCLKRE